MRRQLAGLACLLGLVAGTVLPAPPAAASAAYSWGDYGGTYARTRVSALPASIPAGAGLYTVPWVVPSPAPTARSQSTPVVVGGTIYWFAFTSPTEGALYSSTFAGGEPGPAATLTTFTASTGPGGTEEYNSPSDPSISPDGRWLAFAAGYHLYWWRVGDWCAASSGPSCPSGMRTIPYAPGSPAAFVSSAPTFVADPAPGSGGWAVCSGSGNGGFTCYAVKGAGSFFPSSPPYTTAGSPITSSAVVVPASAASFGGDPAVCFGIASFARPRIECVDPLGNARRTIGLGEIRAPVGSALAYAGGDLWATDQYGGAYAFVASSGALVGRNLSAAMTGGGLSIAPPTVDLATGQVFTVADGYGTICSLQAAGGLAFWPGGAPTSCFNASQLQGASGQFTAPTATQNGSGCDVVWDATNSGLVGASDLCSTHPPAQIHAAPDAGRSGHNFSAAVVGVGPGSQYLVMWADQAVAYYQNECGGCVWSNNPYAHIVTAPPAGAPGGGLEVWMLAPPLDAWLVTDPAPAGQGGECVFAMTSLGSALTHMTYSDPYQTNVPMRAVPGRQAVNAPGLTGCPPPRPGPGDYADLLAEWGAVPPGGTTTEAGGTTPPGQWGAGGTEFFAGTGVTVPTTQASMPVTVTATTAQGGKVTAVATLYTNCPSYDIVGAGGACQTPPPTPAGNNGGSGTAGWAGPMTPQQCLARADRCVGSVLVQGPGPKGQPWPR